MKLLIIGAPLEHQSPEVRQRIREVAVNASVCLGGEISVERIEQAIMDLALSKHKTTVLLDDFKRLSELHVAEEEFERISKINFAIPLLADVKEKSINKGIPYPKKYKRNRYS